MQKNNMVACPYCGQEFKRITSKHLEKHNVSYDEYLKKYNSIKYMENLFIKFFDEYYITVRSKYLLYSTDGQTYTINSKKTISRVDETTGEVIESRALPLCKKQLQQHIKLKETIGIFFPAIGTKLIGLDLDINKIFNLTI